MRWGRAIVVIVSVVFVIACGDGAKTNRVVAHGPVFVVSDSTFAINIPDTIALGTVRDGEVVVREFRLRNDSDVPMVILGLDANCGCIEVDYDRHPIAPGEVCAMELTYHVDGLFAGWQQKSVYIATSLAPQKFRMVVTSFVKL